MIAFHFPPLVGTSGIQRTLRFVQHLPSLGWKPVVLTVKPAIYDAVDEATTAQLPPECAVIRVPCLDTAKHLSFRGRYLSALAVPDRWMSWQWLAVGAAVRAARERGASAIWSTYPIATAHRIGAAAARRTGLPWIADFRDPMAQDGYPAEPARWRAFRNIEETATREAARMVFVAPSALTMYRERYPQTPAERFTLIENGYDEAPFAQAGERRPTPRAGRPLVLLHSGIVYPSERDPRALFAALEELARDGRIAAGDFVIRFRAPVHFELLRGLAEAHRVTGFVELAQPIPYEQAIGEMMSSDALLVMQGQNCNAQIPAKLYEYLRAGRPILGLADPAGDTARTLAGFGIDAIATLESKEEIVAMLPAFIEAVRGDAATAPTAETVRRCSRRALTERLAQVLEAVGKPR